jgi:hypothetical protein
MLNFLMSALISAARSRTALPGDQSSDAVANGETDQDTDDQRAHSRPYTKRSPAVRKIGYVLSLLIALIFLQTNPAPAQVVGGGVWATPKLAAAAHRHGSRTVRKPRCKPSRCIAAGTGKINSPTIASPSPRCGPASAARRLPDYRRPAAEYAAW